MSELTVKEVVEFLAAKSYRCAFHINDEYEGDIDDVYFRSVEQFIRPPVKQEINVDDLSRSELLDLQDKITAKLRKEY